MNALLLEKVTMKEAIAPASGVGGKTGARCTLAKGESVAIVIHLGASLASTVIASLQQHNAAAAGVSKALSVANVYYKKAGAATVFTKVEPTAAASSFDESTDFSTDGGILVLEVKQEDLDVNNNFTHVSVDLADTVAVKVLAAMYVVNDCRQLPAYAQAV